MTSAITSTSHGAYAQVPSTLSKNKANETAAPAVASSKNQTNEPQDKVEISSSTVTDKPNTYSKPDGNSTKVSSEDISSLIAESKRQTDEFMNLVRGLITKQGLDFSKVVRGEQRLTVEDPQTIADAKAAIAPDGEYGIKKTAENILNFAKNFLSADPSKFELIRDSIIKGFEAAKQVLGGVLPDISNQTYDVIMKELDRWKADGIPTGDINVTVE